MVVFDLSIGVGAQIQNYETEDISEENIFNTEIPELICGETICEKKDLIAQAQSGTGKTATFSIGLLNNI